jgi:NTE family protein
VNATPFSTLLVRPATTAGEDPPLLDGPRHSPAAGERALVLGGGGAVGNAWSIGVLAGLLDGGLDVTDADLLVGTSAGSTTAVQIAGASPADLVAAVLDAPPPPRTAPGGPGGGRPPVRSAAEQMDRTGRIIAGSADPADMRRRLGAAALELAAASDGSWQARWRETVAARLPGRTWPERAVLVTAVEARTGRPVVFDRGSGVDLVDAVAASCSSGLPYAIGGTSYLDGGYRRSSENADLAAGCARVLVLSPFGGRTRAPLHWGMQLATQVDELRAGGSRVETVVPDPGTEDLLGARAVDLSLRPAAARAGRDRGRALAEQLTGFWR